jgi:hypothetical protein
MSDMLPIGTVNEKASLLLLLLLAKQKPYSGS